ncbi:MAG: helix-turn-helix transcriptional regulator, partial [Yoonia sp.]
MTKLSTDDQSRFDKDNHIYDYVGGQMRSHRIGRGLTQAQVAKVIGISPQQYQKYEDAQSRCSLTSLETLATFYGVAFTAFLPEETSPPLMINEADLLARLVSSYSLLGSANKKLRLVQLVEA